MDSTHVHLLLNHFPIVGTLIGSVLLFFGMYYKSSNIQKASLFIIAIMAIIVIPVFLTGEPAEEAVEKLPGVLESMIKEHEEAAEKAFWVMMALGLIALIALAFLMMKHQYARTLVFFTLLISVVTFGLMAYTGYLGGQIRHTEIRGNSNTTIQPSNEQGTNEVED
jgi:uncharacterized membrane protein